MVGTKSLVALTLLAIFLAPMLYVHSMPATADTGTITIGLDLAHGENDKYISNISAYLDYANVVVINETFDAVDLSQFDVIVLGQPTVPLSPDELVALADWYASGHKVLWIAGDSDYGSGNETQIIVNSIAEYIGTHLRLSMGAIYDDVNNAQRFYRVLAQVYPDADASNVSTNISNPILAHGPDAVVYLNGDEFDSLACDVVPDGVIRIARYFPEAYVADNNPPLTMFAEYMGAIPGSSATADAVTGCDGARYTFIAAEIVGNGLVIVSGESPYGDYEPTFADEYYNVTLDGPQFLYNVFMWAYNYAQNLVTPIEPQFTIGLDLAHGENDKYISNISAYLDYANVVVINETFDAVDLSQFDVIVLGQPTVPLSPDELVALADWYASGHKVLWIAGDSDYGSGNETQIIVNSIAEYIGTHLRLSLGAIYDDINNAQRFYRVLAEVAPDPDASEVASGISNPILAHGPDAVVYLNGDEFDSLACDVVPDGVIRIARYFPEAYVADNNPPLTMFAEYMGAIPGSSATADAVTGCDGARYTFIAAEIVGNGLVIVSGESPYGDYEPTFADEYYNVTLDGPQFLYNVFMWAYNYAQNLTATQPPSTGENQTTNETTPTENQTTNETTPSPEEGGTTTPPTNETPEETPTPTTNETTNETGGTATNETTTEEEGGGTNVALIAGAVIILLAVIAAVYILKR